MLLPEISFMRIDTAPRKVISRCFSHEKKVKGLSWSHDYMSEVSKFSKELFVRGQHMLVLAGLEKSEELATIAAVFEKKQGSLSLYYTEIKTDAKTALEALLINADQDFEIYKFLSLDRRL